MNESRAILDALESAEVENLGRREREKVMHRRLILQAALDLFADKGFHNVTMHAIAARAEFAIGTLYSFFKNKEELYKATMVDQTLKYEKTLTKVMDAADGERAEIEAYLKARGEFFRDRRKTFRLYFAEMRGASFNFQSGLDAEIRASYDRVIERLADIFRRGIAGGVFADFDPFDLAVALDSLGNSAHFRWMREPQKYPYERTVARMLDIFLSRVALE